MESPHGREPDAAAPVSRGYASYVLGVLFVVYVFNFITGRCSRS